MPVTTCSHGATPVRDCGSPRPHGPPGSAQPHGRTASIPDSPRRGTSGRAAPASAPRGSALTPVRCASGRLFLENSRLEHSEDKSSILGQGGSGTVIYRARYQGQPVAVKQFHIKKFKNFANAPAGNQPLRRRLSDRCLSDRCCVQTSQSPEAAGGGRGAGEAVTGPGDGRLAPDGTWARPEARRKGACRSLLGITLLPRHEPPGARVARTMSTCSVSGTGLAPGGHVIRPWADPLSPWDPVSRLP